MTSNYFRQYIAGYTVANFLRYPIRRRVTNSCALELIFMALYAVLYKIDCMACMYNTLFYFQC